MNKSPEIICPLCGNRFTTTDLATCQFCADKGKCTLMCCPRCGYSFPQRPSAGPKSSFWRRLLSRRANRGHG
jgi:RecJ-like exonuclease